MQRQSEFQRSSRIEIDDHAFDKQDLAIRQNAIRIHNIDMASRQVMEDCENGAAWICLDVHERHELAVEKRLLDADVMVFVPCEEDRVEIRRGRKWVIPRTPILGGYVLVRCALDAHAFMGLLSIKGVNGIVGGAVKPWRINDKTMKLFMMLHDDGALTKMVADLRLKVGDKVTVKAGPWVGSEGLIVQMPKVKKRGLQKLDVVISISIFGRLVDFSMPLAFIGKL